MPLRFMDGLKQIQRRFRRTRSKAGEVKPIDGDDPPVFPGGRVRQSRQFQQPVHAANRFETGNEEEIHVRARRKNRLGGHRFDALDSVCGVLRSDSANHRVCRCFLAHHKGGLRTAQIKKQNARLRFLLAGLHFRLQLLQAAVHLLDDLGGFLVPADRLADRQQAPLCAFEGQRLFEQQDGYARHAQLLNHLRRFHILLSNDESRFQRKNALRVQLILVPDAWKRLENMYRVGGGGVASNDSAASSQREEDLGDASVQADDAL